MCGCRFSAVSSLGLKILRDLLTQALRVPAPFRGMSPFLVWVLAVRVPVRVSVLVLELGTGQLGLRLTQTCTPSPQPWPLALPSVVSPVLPSQALALLGGLPGTSAPKPPLFFH